MKGIVVGVDDSPEAVRALRWAVEEARLRGVTLHVMSAWEFPFKGLGPEHHDRSEHDAPVGPLEQSALDELAEAVTAAGGDAGVTVDRHVVRASPVRMLLDAANDADLLVVGSRGHGGFAGLVLGSVSQHCVRHAACPVVVVH
jgi:nucleotide-binding universal stress UspA family protein